MIYNLTMEYFKKMSDFLEKNEYSGFLVFALVFTLAVVIFI